MAAVRHPGHSSPCCVFSTAQSPHDAACILCSRKSLVIRMCKLHEDRDFIVQCLALSNYLLDLKRITL